MVQQPPKLLEATAQRKRESIREIPHDDRQNQKQISATLAAAAVVGRCWHISAAATRKGSSCCRVLMAMGAARLPPPMLVDVVMDGLSSVHYLARLALYIDDDDVWEAGVGFIRR